MANTWNQSVTQTEGDLKALFQEGKLRNLLVQETLAGYIVLAEGKLSTFNAKTGGYDQLWQPVVWCTKRAEDPRYFSSLERLLDLLGDSFPTVGTVRIEVLPLKERKKKADLLLSRVKDPDGVKKRGRPPGLRLDPTGKPKPLKKTVPKAPKPAAKKAAKPAKKAVKKRAK